jgi:pimeloyl-ACP methyl ester carboxylesterase
VPLILAHGWPGSFLDYVDMLPMLEHFDVVIPFLPGYGFSPRPAKAGVNYRYGCFAIKQKASKNSRLLRKLLGGERIFFA